MKRFSQFLLVNASAALMMQGPAIAQTVQPHEPLQFSLTQTKEAPAVQPNAIGGPIPPTPPTVALPNVPQVVSAQAQPPIKQEPKHWSEMNQAELTNELARTDVRYSPKEKKRMRARLRGLELGKIKVEEPVAAVQEQPADNSAVVPEPSEPGKEEEPMASETEGAKKTERVSSQDALKKAPTEETATGTKEPVGLTNPSTSRDRLKQKLEDRKKGFKTRRDSGEDTNGRGANN